MVKVNRFSGATRRLPVCFSVIASVAFFAIGCGGDTVTTLAAKGQVVTADGKPCDGALVVFHPRDADKINDPKPVATTDAEGRFVLTTHVENDGAEPGKYGVTIVWNQVAKENTFSLSDEGDGGVDKLGGRYGDPGDTKLEAVVEPGKENDFRFEVK